MYKLVFTQHNSAMDALVMPYDTIQVGISDPNSTLVNKVYNSAGEEVLILSKHSAIFSSSGKTEERLVYVYLSDLNGTKYSVPAGINGEKFYATKPSPEQISVNKASTTEPGSSEVLVDTMQT